MCRRFIFTVGVLLSSFALVWADNWPQWRGPALNGVSKEKNLPLRWSKEENIAWKLALPGLSAATPAIWGERIFLNVTDGDQLQLWCVDKRSGALLWKKQQDGKNLKLGKHNPSSPSPVTDGQYVYVVNAYGHAHAYDFAGNEIWTRNLWKEYGRFGLNFGHASSPLLFEDALYIQMLQVTKDNAPSYLLRLAKTTGKTVWKADFPASPDFKPAEGYSTPTIFNRAGKAELIVNGTDQVTSHDVQTGRELWRVAGLTTDKEPSRIASSPIVADGVIYAASGHRPLLALRPGNGEAQRLWSSRNSPDVPSPVTDGKYFYTVDDKGIARCLDAKTGQEIWGPQRLKVGDYSASPVLADGKLYIISEEGLTTVLKAGAKFEKLAENGLDDVCLSSPAVSDGQIFIRTAGFLYCIGKRVAQ
ncbi:MAG TPA: PQQ-binding-like beta-propeller repeat protein [Blastocatellia bacterium]|nr:PQQ-binding-like beta-propeller repeat protein [Blastocatellia bacterium]HMV82243.1 PQQ-binding-like beta-propeller repeat protein [Blastocatellia bacterium]HMY76023.1 PQQ-binding-like beta-propeller repeat protein [Blastocatellia bacterium]HMZ17077.1 PQQ-binding-like beta-propeller repeat protein [Blastocatellia bacterium]HNG32376.1 PQQ-binding-like beta-propeller repeat protein [Blastocatellia bacterium]